MKKDSRSIAVLLVAVMMIAAAADLALAAWSTDTAVNNQVWYSTAYKACPANISDGAGGVITMWYGPASSIYLQHLNADGVSQWSVVVISATSQEIRPVIISDGAGGAIVAWSRPNETYDDYNIYAQRVDAAGAVRWTAGGAPICTAGGNQHHPTVAPDQAGGAVITWQDERSSPEPDIYAQRIDASGAVMWTPNGTAVCATAGWQTEPVIAGDGAGGAIIAWTDSRLGTGYYDVFAQHVSALGSGLWTANGTPVCAAADEQSGVNIISDGVGGAIVSWQDYRNGGVTQYDIYAQRLSGGGASLWAFDGQAICATADFEYTPCLAGDGSGGAIFAWYNYVSSSGSMDLFAQRINATGSVMWASSGVPICTAAGTQNGPAVTRDGAGGAIITWTDSRGANSDIYAQRVNGAGAIQWAANGIAIATAAPSQSAPTIATDGTGGAIIAWMEQRGIYASQVGANGILGSRAPASAVGPIGDAPRIALLSQNTPNPFNPRTTIRFELTRPGSVRLDVFDVAGRLVRQLVDADLGAGRHEVSWDGRDERGHEAASGSYLARLECEGWVETVRMGLVR